MVVQDQPSWITAVETRGVLTVSHSPLVRFDDREFTPVYEYLRTTCHDKPSPQRSIEDPQMMFGRALVTTYKIHTRCPGASVNHVCGVSTRVKAG